VKVHIGDVEIKEDGLEVVAHQLNDNSNASADECEFHNGIRTLAVTDLTPSYDIAQLRVIRYTLAQLEQVNDWGRTAIFQTCTKKMRTIVVK